MKLHLVKLASLFFAAIPLLVSSPSMLHAQDTPIMSINVPFPFTAEGVSLPAGRYDVSTPLRARFWILTTYGHVPVELHVVGQELSKAAPLSSLTFDHDQNGYTLRQIQEAGYTDAAQVRPGRAAKTTPLHEANMRPLPSQTADALTKKTVIVQ